MNLRIAIQGCCHGELDKIYQELPPVDLLIICGDFQALRNTTDFDTISMPPKYKRLGDFQSYYSGQKVAPVLTLFIGGNHECSSYMKELKYGGWVAPKIYYLGEFGSVWFKGLQISGWSGIFNWQSFVRNDVKDEKLPYTPDSLRSIYHSKPKNYLKMLLLEQPDIVLSHDWPVNIEQHGNVRKLLSQKKFFKEDIERNQLGSPLNKILLNKLQPRYWFSSHLHVRFEAKVEHSSVHNDDEIELDMDAPDEPTKSEKNTQFLALDKCLPKRRHLEIIQIPVKNPNHPSVKYEGFYYNKRAIAINRIVEDYLIQNVLSFKKIDMRSVLTDPSNFRILSELSELVEKQLGTLQDQELEIPEEFSAVAPIEGVVPLQYWENVQTTEYCKKFDIPYEKLKWAEGRSRSRSPRRR